MERPFTLPQFAALMVAPITPQYDGHPGAHAPSVGAGGRKAKLPRRGSKARLTDSAGGPVSLLLAWLAKLALISAVVYALQYNLPKPLRAFVMCEWPAL